METLSTYCASPGFSETRPEVLWSKIVWPLPALHVSSFVGVLKALSFKVILSYHDLYTINSLQRTS